MPRLGIRQELRLVFRPGRPSLVCARSCEHANACFMRKVASALARNDHALLAKSDPPPRPVGWCFAAGQELSCRTARAVWGWPCRSRRSNRFAAAAGAQCIFCRTRFIPRGEGSSGEARLLVTAGRNDRYCSRRVSVLYMLVAWSTVNFMKARYKSGEQLGAKGKTQRNTVEGFAVTTSRIGQEKPHQQCAIHGLGYATRCFRCAIQEKIDRALARVDRDGLMPEIREMKARNRRSQIVASRASMVKRLYDRYGLSFLQIGKLLGRDHSSVIHLYYKK